MRRALFVGRFQPFHLGHMSALSWILERADEVIIGIGSAQYSHTLDNPFTSGERVEMIWNAIRESGFWDRCVITLIQDTDGRHALWVPLVLSLCPRFDAVYSNDPLTRRLFKEGGIEVNEVPLFSRDRFEGRNIRRLMIEGGPWDRYVPNIVAKFIESIGGVERLREIYQRTNVY